LGIWGVELDALMRLSQFVPVLQIHTGFETHPAQCASKLAQNNVINEPYLRVCAKNQGKIGQNQHSLI